MRESTLVDNIRKALKKRGIKTIKVHGNALMEAGTPDILGCIPHSVVITGQPYFYGQFLALEVKRDDKAHPTPLQRRRLAEWQEAGAVTAVVWSVASALAVVEGE